MAKPFKIDLVGDARGFLRAGRDVADQLEQVADSLDQVATESKAGADTLETKFTDAYKTVRTESSKTGKAIGDDIHDGTRKAAEGVDDFKGEAKSSAKEAAASFSGEFSDVGDLIQEVLANAFEGFGPAGLAAGAAAAAGIGLLIKGLQDAADAAAATKQATIDLAGELADVKGNPAALDWAAKLRTQLSEIVDTKEWWEFWQDQPKTRLEQWSKAAKQYGLSIADMARSSTGDMGALERVTRQLDEQINRLNATYVQTAGGGAEWQAAQPDLAALTALRDELTRQAGSVAAASDMYRTMQEAIGGVTTTTTETLPAASTATSDYTRAVQTALDGAGQSWEDYITKGKVNLAEYNKAIESERAAIVKYESNLRTASQALSGEALAYIQALGPAAAPLLQAYIDAPLAQKQRTAANWAVLGRTAKDSFIADLNLTSAVDQAVDAANAKPRALHVRAQLDKLDLQRQAQEAAAAIPMVNIKARFVGMTPAIG